MILFHVFAQVLLAKLEQPGMSAADKKGLIKTVKVLAESIDKLKKELTEGTSASVPPARKAVPAQSPPKSKQQVCTLNAHDGSR